MTSLRERVRKRFTEYRAGYSTTGTTTFSRFKRNHIHKTATQSQDFPVVDVSPESREQADTASILFDDRAEMDQQGMAERVAELQSQLVAMAIENERLKNVGSHKTDDIVFDTNKSNTSIEAVPLSNTSVMNGENVVDDEESNMPNSAKELELRRRQLAQSSDALSEDYIDRDEDPINRLLSSVRVTPADENSTFVEKVKSYVTERIQELSDDLCPEKTESVVLLENYPLSPKKLKNNFVRFNEGIRPFIAFFVGLSDIFLWKNPSYTIIVFAFYYFVLFRGLILPALLLVIIVRLSLNYAVNILGYDWQFNFVSDYAAEDENDDETREVARVGAQVNFVVHVAKKVQLISGKIADGIEKLKNLVTWQSPEITLKLYRVLCIVFALSLILPTSSVFFYSAVYFGIKMFFIEPVYTRYPRLKRKYDTVYKKWRLLPTDEQLRGNRTNEDVEKYMLSYDEKDSEFLDESGNNSMDSDDELFCQVFNLPNKECPLQRWKGGKRCAIIIKEADKALPQSLKHGKIFLTRSFFCFERSKDRNKTKKRNIVVPLSMIESVIKTKPFSWFPGGGMALDIKVFGVQRPLTFGALISRDDLFDSLMTVGKKAGLQYATSDVSLSQAANGENITQFIGEADPKVVASVFTALASDSDSED